MSHDRKDKAQSASSILSVERLPARLHVEEVAALLGFSTHDIPFLIACGLLTPLGKPTPAATKHFAAVEILERAEDVAWLDKASKAIYKKWRSNNSKRTKTAEDEQLQQVA